MAEKGHKELLKAGANFWELEKGKRRAFSGYYGKREKGKQFAFVLVRRTMSWVLEKIKGKEQEG